MRTLVLGFGNELREDDALGLHFARAADGPDCTSLSCRHLTPELAEALAGSERVLFADASRGLTEVRLTRVPEQPRPWPLHAGSPGALLALTRSLYGHAPEGWLLSLPGERFGFGTSLSPRGEESLAKGRELFRDWKTISNRG